MHLLSRKGEVKALSRVRLCGPVDCSLPGSSVPEIFQARVLEWGAPAFSRETYITICKIDSQWEFAV